MDLSYTFTLVLFGALGGLFRTYISHDAKLIWVMIDPKRKRMRFGFLVSVAMGAFVSFLSTVGIVTFMPMEAPDSIWTTMALGFVTGLASQTILEKLTGLKLKDPDNLVIGDDQYTPLEMNLPKRKMYEYIMENIPGVERILIMDGDVAGIMKVIVVPEVGADAEKVKIKTENAINKMKCPGIQVYVKLPTERHVDLSLTVEVMDGEDIEKTTRTHTKKIREVIKTYIDTLPPGSPVLKSKIIATVVASSTLIRDVRGDKIICETPFDHGRIPIGRFEVARSGNIDVKLIVRTIGDHDF